MPPAAVSDMFPSQFWLVSAPPSTVTSHSDVPAGVSVDVPAALLFWTVIEPPVSVSESPAAIEPPTALPSATLPTADAVASLLCTMIASPVSVTSPWLRIAPPLALLTPTALLSLTVIPLSADSVTPELAWIAPP